MIKRLMILSLLLVSMISKSWAYSFINGFCEYEVISEEEQTVRLIGFDWCDYVPGTDININLPRFVTDESANMTYELKEMNINSYSCEAPTTIGTLYIPVSVEKIDGILSFEYSSIIVAEGNPVYDSRNNCNAIIETATNKLVHGCKNTVIPSSVTSIGISAFSGSSGLTGIVIPGSLTSIGARAFDDCSGLIGISIPSSVTSIGDYAFTGCSSLATITVEAGNPVYDSRNNCNAIIETATNELISGCKNTVIPSSVTSIGWLAFIRCTGLTSVSIPSSVTSIGSGAFYGCSGLTGISIPSSVTSIGDKAFFECSGLTTITVEAGNPVYDSRNNCNAIIETATNELISGCNNTVIPSSVTSIGDYAFTGCSGLTSISIPSSVTSIGDQAFDGCSGLTSISIPSSVTSIGNYAFYGCSGLTSVTCKSSIPPSLGESVFSSTSTSTLYVPAGSKAAYEAASVWNEFKEIIEIENITFADSKVKEICVANWDVNKDGELSYAEAAAVTSIDRVFNGNEEITSFNELQYFTGLTSIDGHAFDGCTCLTSVSIPSSVTSIGELAFDRCTGLTGIVIPGSLTSIGYGAFSGCSGLTTITVEAGNPVYDSRNNCNAIIETATNELIFGCKNTDIPSSVTSIGANAFYGCTRLTSIVIPSSVTSIGGLAFYRCSGLTGIVIPGSVTSIDNYAFSDCSGLTTITVKAGNPVYDSRNNCNAIIETATNELISGCKNTVIPSSVTSIGDVAFSGCSGLTGISIPSSVTIIGGHAFYGCSGLTGISIPSSVTSIGGYAFTGCSGLTTITVEAGNPVYDSRNNCNAIIETATNELISGCKNTVIPSSVTSIGDLSFGYCSGLTIIVIPGSVTSIGDYAFYGCSGLTSVTCKSSTPPSLGEDVFSNRANATLYVPAGSKAAYEAASVWNEFKEIIEIENITFADSKVKEICVANWDVNKDGELSYAEAAAVTSIGQVFYGNSEITSFNELQYFTGLTSIGDQAFSGCTCLTSVSIPNSVTSIGSLVFSACSGLTTITVDADNPVYDSRNNCNAIIETATNELIFGCKNTDIPSSVTSIGSWAFDCCTGLTGIVIPGSLTSIGYGAFYGCSGLTSVSIPSSVTSIGNFAFGYCSGLTGIVIPGSLTSIGDYAFSGCSGLTTITVEAGNPVYDSRNNCNAIIETATNELISGCNNTVIPSSVTSIGDYAFRNCFGLTGIVIPSSVTSIGSGAFSACNGLTSVTCKSSTPPSLGEDVFFGTPTSTLYVPAGSKAAYEEASVWKEFKEIEPIATLTINKYGSGTYCSPYALDFTNVSGMKAYVAAGYNTTTNTVYMLSVKTAQPGEGLFIKGAPGDYTVPEIETSTDNYLNLLVGTTNEITVNAQSDDGKYTNYAYSLNKGTDVPAFYKYSNGSKCMAYKAYLQIPTSWLPTLSEAKTVKLVFDDEEPTGIEEFRTEKDVDDVKIYDMQGRRVAKPGKGLYIVNGKKVVFK